MALVAVIGTGGYWTYLKYGVKHETRAAMSVIPEDAIFIVETNDLSKAWTEISNSKVWNFLIQNAYFEDINEDIEMLNTYLKNNAAAGLALQNRELMLSAHMISGKDWDMLYVVDLKDVASTLLDQGLKKALGFVEGYKVDERDYKGNKIVELSSETDPSDIVFITVSDNLLIASFTGSLIEKAIDEKANDKWAKNTLLTEVTQNLGGKKLFRFYFNYAQLDNFSKAYMTEDSESLNMLANSLAFSALNINLENEMLRFEGYTNIDSIGSYVRALANVKPGKMGAWKIMSDQTSMYMSMGFENYMDFYNNLTEQFAAGNAEDMEDIEGYVRTTEKLLKISFQDDFFSWIGNEIAFIKLNPGRDTRMEDVVVAFHAKDINDAKAGMGHIMKMIKKRTPTKFTSETYKNFELYQLERRDFFKMFFGKMFKSLEKPYFTYIEDYMVMSNSLKTLKNIVDDYTTGSTLARRSKFVDFKDEFSNKSNLTVFIRTPKIYQNLYYYSNAADRKDIKENKEFILSFARIGFQLVSKGDMFETTFLAQHDPDAVQADKLEQFEKEVSEDLFKTDIDSLRFKIKLPLEALQKDTLYEELYDGKSVVKYQGQIEDNAINGVWKTYYPSGNIQSSVNYVYGKVEGEAFFYFDDSKKTMKARATFDDEKIIDYYEEYYDNGARKARIEYDDGLPDGEAEFYYRTGKIKIEAEYRKGQKHGKWKYYNEKGELIGKEKWKNGVLK